MGPMSLPRKVTVYLSAPPGDGIQAAREHFRDYVKPLLNAAAVDFDVVEGRKTGELRFKVAEEVRALRRGDEDGPIETVRKAVGIKRVEEGGVVVVGRHAWKEYVRGVQEGWLGPLEEPAEPAAPPPAPVEPVERVESLEDAIAVKPEEPLDEKALELAEKALEIAEKKRKAAIPEPLMGPAEFANAQLPRGFPQELEPAGVVSHPHILGFLKTPIRMYRYVTRRHMAEIVCREAAAVALGIHRPFNATGEDVSATSEEREDLEDNNDENKVPVEKGEINALKIEEKDWPSRVWKEDKYKGVWIEPFTVDQRIAEKMSRFYIPDDMVPKDPKETQK